MKLKPAENPLGMSVYKLGAKDGRGSWFARRSVHEGLGFEKWKKGLEKEFPETMKVQGGPGEGNIRGIGGERRVEFKGVDGVGKMEGLFRFFLERPSLINCSLSSFGTISWTYYSQRFCYYALDLRSGAIRQIWRK